MAETRPGNQERGWNDPPVFLHNTSGEHHQTPKKTLLNKRVAYPVTGSAGTQTGVGTSSLSGSTPPLHRSGGCSTPPMVGTLAGPRSGTNSPTCGSTPPLQRQGGASTPPKVGALQGPGTYPSLCRSTPPLRTPGDSTPPMVGAAPSPIPSIPPVGYQTPPTARHPPSCSGDGSGVVDQTENSCEDEGEMLKDTLKRLDAVVDQLKVRTQEDVKKKLLIFHECWLLGRISRHVKLKMHSLAKALEERNCDEANMIHLQLMMDYTNEVGQWMVGIKKLIYEARSLPKTTVEGTESSTETGIQKDSDCSCEGGGAKGSQDTFSETKVSGAVDNQGGKSTENTNVTSTSFRRNSSDGSIVPQVPSEPLVPSEPQEVLDSMSYIERT